MKEIKIKVSSIARELKIWGILLIFAFITNIYAIYKFEGQWSELYSQLHIIIILSVIYYAVVLLLRGITFGIKFFFKRSVDPV